MKFHLLALLVLIVALTGCVAPVGPVAVTRFHAADIAPLGKATIGIEAGAGMDAGSLEQQAYQAAVNQQLQRLSFNTAASGAGEQVAIVRVTRNRYRPERTRGPVSVGVGGSAGSYGSGLGLGIGIDLSGKPPEQVETQLSVTIRDRKSGTALWEGRANFTVSAKSPMAETSLGAAKVAEALFRGFPGRSGETIEVK
jgi:hypothetical protein